MSTQYDEKGKFFTEIIPKEAIPVTIQTITHCIHGILHKRQRIRLIDELNRYDQDKFLAITNVTVFNDEGNTVYQTEFMVVKIDQIVWLIPDDEVKAQTVIGGDS